MPPNLHGGELENWKADSGATGHMTLDATALKDYIVKIAKHIFVPVQVYGRMEFESGKNQNSQNEECRLRAISGT